MEVFLAKHINTDQTGSCLLSRRLAAFMAADSKAFESCSGTPSNDSYRSQSNFQHSQGMNESSGEKWLLGVDCGELPPRRGWRISGTDIAYVSFDLRERTSCVVPLYASRK